MRVQFSLGKRALPFVGYLVTTFNDQQPGVLQLLSKGASDAYNFRSLNGGKPVVTSSFGTHGTRDPFVLAGADRSNFWMLATDLDIGKTSWHESQTHGSRDIMIWSSSDLTSWTQHSAATLEGAEAGYVWAPSAVKYQGEYVVFWSARIYAKDDTKHERTPLYTTIRYSKTKDFKAFTPPQNYITPSTTAKIDQEILEIGNGEFVRFIKDENSMSIIVEKSQGGLFGTWTTMGPRIQNREGPLAFRDIDDPNKVHLWVDRFGGANGYGYDAWETTSIANGAFTRSGKPVTPSGIRHGSVTPLTSGEYSRIAKKWNVAV